MRLLAPGRGHGVRRGCTGTRRPPLTRAAARAAAQPQAKGGASKGFGKQRAEHIQASTAGDAGARTRPAKLAPPPPSEHPAHAAEPADASAFGPLGLLLTGFSEADAAAVRAWLAPIDPHFAVSCCSPQLLDAPLEAAITGPDGGFRHDPGWHALDPGIPRVALFSGVSRQQALDLAGLWHLSGVREPTFMAAVAPAAGRPLLSLLQEVEAHTREAREGPVQQLDAASLRVQLRQRMAQKLGSLPSTLDSSKAASEAGLIRPTQ